MLPVLLASLVAAAAPSDAPFSDPPLLEVPPPPAVSGRPVLGIGPTPLRVGVEILVAGAAGVLSGLSGAFAGCLLSPQDQGRDCSNATVAAGALTGYGIAVAALVPVVGGALDGHGEAVGAWVGEAIGTGVGLLSASGHADRAMFIAPPLMLLGAVLGYELTGAPRAPVRSLRIEAVGLAPAGAGDGVTMAMRGRF